MLLGAHESISGRLGRAVEDAVEDGCECVQIFTKNQTQWKDPELDDDQVSRVRPLSLARFTR
jgi:deoxyribonuclease-4